MKLSLKRKMLVLVFGLIMVPTLILGINDYRTSKNLLAENLRTSAREILHGTTEAADLFLKSLEEAIVMLSKDVNIQSMTIKSARGCTTPSQRTQIHMKTSRLYTLA